MLASMSMLRAL